MTRIDITRTVGLDDLVFPGDPQPRLQAVNTDIANGGYTITKLMMTTHTGTHIDAPRHFIPEGTTIELIPLARFDLVAHVLYVPGTGVITSEQVDLSKVMPGSAVLFKTGNSDLTRDHYEPRHAAVGIELAKQLVKLGVTLVGIDYISIERGDDTAYPVHRCLLGAGVLILEDIDLRSVRQGLYQLTCFPLKLHRAEAAPCRAILTPCKPPTPA